MSSHVLPCSVPYCAAEFRSSYPNLVPARREARNAGWRADEVTKRNWCPEHAVDQRTGHKRRLTPASARQVRITVVPGNPKHRSCERG